MALDRQTVHRIAELARIHVSDEDVERYRAELSRILDLVEQMEAVDTNAVTPLTHPQDQRLRLRDDRVTESDRHERFQAIAPAVEAGLYLVPRVIE